MADSTRGRGCRQQCLQNGHECWGVFRALGQIWVDCWGTLVEEALLISILGSCKRFCSGLRDFPASRAPPHSAATPENITVRAKPANRGTPIAASVRCEEATVWHATWCGVYSTAGFGRLLGEGNIWPQCENVAKKRCAKIGWLALSVDRERYNTLGRVRIGQHA